MYNELVRELRELSFKFAKMIATEDLTLSEGYRASAMYMLLLAAKDLSLGGKAEVKGGELQCF